MERFLIADIAAVRQSLWWALLVLVAGLVLFSQTWAWYGDEGFHLLTSQLINAGKRPYLDFVYPQTPLYAYLDAGWMWLLSDTWRSSHALSALLTGGSIILAAGFVLKRLPQLEWQLSAALLTAILFGLNSLVIRFGTIGQPYGTCLFLIVASFRLIINATTESRTALFLWAGVCAGASAGCSLLCAPVVPTLLAWTAWRSVKEERLRKCAWLLLGTVISFLPMFWLAVLGPRQTLFNTFEYHFFYRADSNWAAVRDNLKVLTEVLNSNQFLLLIVFAAAGLLFVVGRSQWGTRERAEFYLCGWLAAALAIFLSTVRFTFHQYFVLLSPFLSILSSVGIMAIASCLRAPGRPAWLIPGVLLLYMAGLPWWLWQQHRQLHWSQLEEVARAVNRVTPEGGSVWADEGIYFAARRIPPSGLEHSDSHRLRLSPDYAAEMHVVSRPDLYAWVAAGRFETVASCWATDDWIDSSGLRKVYAERTTVHGCDIFWSKISR